MWRMKGSFEAHGSHVRILSGPVYIIMWHLNIKLNIMVE